jgi:hypothetical protein
VAFKILGCDIPSGITQMSLTSETFPLLNIRIQFGATKFIDVSLIFPPQNYLHSN